MLKGPIRVAPQWKELQNQLGRRLELQKALPEGAEGTPFLLSDRPSIVFRESCFPSYMPLFCYYATEWGNFFASFTWRRAKRSKVRVWSYSMEDESLVTEKMYTLEEHPGVLTITHVPHVHLFVAYCDDIHFRFFGDHTRDFKLLSKMSSPYLVTSLCYSPETGELISGAIGVVAFWTFLMLEVPSMSVTQEVCVAMGEFVHFLRVEQERKMLVALCENIIRVYDYQTKAQIHTFPMSQGVSLTCCAAYWPQSFLYTGDLAGDVKVWNFDTGTHINQFKAHQSAISNVIVRIAVHSFMTASLDGMLKEWNLTTCELLRRVDIGEEVFQMQFLNEKTFFLRTQYTFSIRTVNNFYQLFNRSKSILKRLVRVQCGPDKARLLATTEDGVIRFLSPVTGEMLFVTWPFQLLEKALDYVYDPDREELLVTMGTSDIYVLDTTKNPCPAKYILRTTDSVDDKVLCLAYSRLDLNGRTTSFIFSGFKSGKVRSVTQQLYRMGGRKLHDGNVVALSSLSRSGYLSYHSREASFLCSYGLDEYIILSEVILKNSHLLEVLPLVVIPSTSCRINILLLIPGYICALTEQNRVRLWRQAALVPGEKNPFWKETAAMHSSTITSFDYCHTLGILVTGGSDGSVRVWDILGKMLVEFDTTLRFSPVCFANQRGDLVVGCNTDIYFISCVAYLPRKHLTSLLTHRVRDDVVEYPLPFLPRFLLTFDIVFVPKYLQVGKQAKKFERMEPLTNHKEVLIEKDVAKVVWFVGRDATSIFPGPDFYGLPPSAPKETLPEFAVEYQLISQPTLGSSLEKKLFSPPPYRGLPRMVEQAPLLQTLRFQEGHSWPIAPDGYIPNSVIRARLFPKGIPPDLWCPLLSSRDPLPKRKLVKIQMPEWDRSDVAEKARKKKAQKMKQTPSGTRSHRDLLAEIMTKPWLRHKPSDTSLPSIIQAILNLMDDVPYSTYLLCTSALVQLTESYPLPSSVQEVAFERLIQDTTHKEVRMRLAAWEALGKMDLLGEPEVVPLAQALLDENKKVRDLARSLLDSVAGITDKFVLKQEMQRLAEMSLEDLTVLSQKERAAFPRRVRAAGIVADSKDEAVYALTEGTERLMACVENQLTANLFLMSEYPPPEAQLLGHPPPSRRRRISEKAAEEYGETEAPETDQARWMGLFGRSGRKDAEVRAITEIKQTSPRKLPRIQQARGKGVAITPSPGAPESSSSSSPTQRTTSTSGSPTTSSGSSAARELRAKKAQREKEKLQQPRVPATHSQEIRRLRKLRKQAPPILLQRRDTRTQLYAEMLKSTKARKEQPAPAVVVPLAKAKAGSSLVQAKPSPVEPPTLPTLPLGLLGPPGAPRPLGAPARGSLIDPKQQYAADKSNWRNDLYKLMMLRIAPSVEGRTAGEDFMASARIALAGQNLSWELLTNLGQALLSSQEKLTTETPAWKKYMDDFIKLSLKESWLQASVASLETVLAVSTAGDMPGSSETNELSQEQVEKVLREEAEERAAVAEKKRLQQHGAKEDKLVQVVSEKEVKRMARLSEKWAAKMDEFSKWRQESVAMAREQELAPSKEQLPARGKEQEHLLEKERGRLLEKEPSGGRTRGAEPWRPKEREATERRGKEVTRLKAGQPAGKEVAAEEMEGTERSQEELPSLEELQKPLLMDSERILAQLSEDTLAEMRAEGKARMMEELKVRALQDALEEVKERALAEARQIALAEAKDRALLRARKKALLEAWEKVLAKAHQKALEEVMERALEEAEKIVQAEGLEGNMAEERLQELVLVIAEELAKERAMELAMLATIEVDEARVLELAEEEAIEIDEVRLLELAEARARELAETRAQELAETAMLAMPEETLLELVEVRAQLLAQAKLMEKQLEQEEEEWAEKTALFFDKEKVGSPEALDDESIWLLSEDEREALVTLWEMDHAPEAEAGLTDQAQLLLEVLTRPETLQRRDSTTFQNLFRVVSLVGVPSAAHLPEMVDALLQKAEDLLKEAEQRQESLSEKQLSVLRHLKEVVEAHKPWNASPRQYGARMKRLFKSALAVLRARNLKKWLTNNVWLQAWQQKVEKAWAQEEGWKERQEEHPEERQEERREERPEERQQVHREKRPEGRREERWEERQEERQQVHREKRPEGRREERWEERREERQQVHREKRQEGRPEERWEERWEEHRKKRPEERREERWEEHQEKRPEECWEEHQEKRREERREERPEEHREKRLAELQEERREEGWKERREVRQEERRKEGWEERREEGQEERREEDRRAWLKKKLRQALGKFQTEQERAQQERRQQQRRERCLKFRSRPIVLGFQEEAEEKKGRAEERGQREVGGGPEGARVAGRRTSSLRKERAARDHGKLTWSMGQQWEKAWHAFLQMEELRPALATPQPSGYRLPKDSLYKTTKPTGRLHRKLLRRGGRQHIFRLDEAKGVDWETFMGLYLSIASMKEEGVVDAVWQEQAATLLDLYGVSNPLVRAMIQQLLVGDHRQRKYVSSRCWRLKRAQADLGQRTLYEMIVHSTQLRPPQPAFHHVIPLNYQNNVQPFKTQGVTHFGPLYLKWKTFFPKGKLPKLSLYVYSHPSS